MIRQILNKTVIGLLLFIFISCSDAASGEAKKRNKLPYIGDPEIVISEKNGVKRTDTIYHRIPDFEYLDQDSNLVKSADFKDKLLIVDFFFTSCSSICKPMTAQMKRLNENLKDLKNEIQFLSFSIDPTNDTPTRLREYIEQRGLVTDNWRLLTGGETATHKLGVDGFKVHAARDDKDDDGFAHSEYFVLVDHDGHIRGLYLGTSADDVDNMEKDTRFLLESEYGIKGKK